MRAERSITALTEEANYKQFCRLRDYRKPGTEVPLYTEAEAFVLATEKCKACSPAITKAASNE
ncbi:hypothetical protein VM94_00875 [Janthinobacterium sp. KBS0711]|nr:hypothetical protein VM94_00875 [Janthinobacterium sp. KBS0711]